MEGKARFIFPVLMAGIMVFIVSALVTFINVGLASDFLLRWGKAFLIAWPAAAAAAFIAIPIARRATGRLVALIEGKS
jgi:hypothetical protein